MRWRQEKFQVFIRRAGSVGERDITWIQMQAILRGQVTTKSAPLCMHAVLNAREGVRYPLGRRLHGSNIKLTCDIDTLLHYF